MVLTYYNNDNIFVGSDPPNLTNSNNSVGIGVARTAGYINLSAYNYMEIKVNIYSNTYGASDASRNHARFGVSTNPSLSNESMTAYVDIPWNTYIPVTKTINVSSLTGNYYFYIYFPAMRKSTSYQSYTECSKITLIT